MPRHTDDEVRVAPSHYPAAPLVAAEAEGGVRRSSVDYVPDVVCEFVVCPFWSREAMLVRDEPVYACASVEFTDERGVTVCGRPRTRKSPKPLVLSVHYDPSEPGEQGQLQPIAARILMKIL